MIPANLLPLANHVWQSTLFAAAACLLTLAFRKNRAAIRYAICLTASVKFLVPFSLLVSIGSQFEWRATPVSGPLPISHIVVQIGQPFVLPVEQLPAAAASASLSPVPAVLLSVWVCGFVTSAFVWLRFWRRFRATVRAGTPIHLDLPILVMTSPGRLEPGVFGIWKPTLLLPEGIFSQLTPKQLQAILAHELCHVRRRDNLTAAVHMLVETIFWFHPLVWWIGRRLVEERERACDEEVVLTGSEPHVYAEGILNVCKFYLQSPLACASGVTGADLRTRIEAIMANRLALRLTAGRKMLLATTGIVAIGAPLLIGLWQAPAARAQSQEKLRFEVASVKPVHPSAGGGGPMALAPGVTPDGGIRSRVPIFNLICWAYRIDGFQLSGGPSWIRSDRYAIEAKPEKFEGPNDQATRLSEKERVDRTRERVKALLADRFRLAVRTELKESAVYVMSIAKGGHKLTPNTEGKGGISYNGDSIESDSAWIRLNWPACIEIGLVAGLLAADRMHLVPFSNTPFLLVLAWVSLRLRHLKWRSVGLVRPDSWTQAITVGIVAGVALECFSLLATEPLIAWATGVSPDRSDMRPVVGSPLMLGVAMALNWTLAAFGEEMAWRGYVLNRIMDFGIRGTLGSFLCLFLTSALFGIAHGESQGLAGILQEGFAGFVLGSLYLASGRRLVVPVIAHGASNSLALVMIFFNRYPGL